MANGVLIVDKPDGWTSQDVAARLRRVFNEKRIGHGGTLDPMATGVLPIFVGRATRAVEFCQSAEKEYIAGLQLGVSTDTQDTTGTVLSQKPVAVSQTQLRQVLASFEGVRQQLPPMYSAVKIGGKKLYELARAGKTVERQPRTITLYELELLSFGEICTLRVRCSKGTYIRTLCSDLGDALGCGGCMSSLRRTRAGSCTLAAAVPLQTLLDSQTPLDYLSPVDSLFAQHPAYTVTGAAERQLRNGAQAAAPQLADGRYRVYSADGEFLLLGSCKDGRLDTVKSFFAVEPDTAARKGNRT